MTKANTDAPKRSFLKTVTGFIWRLFLLGFFTGAVLGLCGLGYIYFSIMPNLPEVAELRQFKLEVPMRVYSADGKLMGEFGQKRRIQATFDEFPPVLVDALVATEDAQFWEHYGVNPKSIARAVYGELTGRNLGGGSTITMQVARNYYGFTRKRDYTRKLKEIILSFKIEKMLTKQEIIELYLNKVFLGQRAYGAAAAALVYYGKDLPDLTLAEAAMIAGLPQAPSDNNPITNPTNAIKRRNFVLSRMLTVGSITQQQHDEAVASPNTARIHSANIEVDDGYISEMARQYMVARYGEDVLSSGYNVYTTIDSRLQEMAYSAIYDGIQTYEQRHGYVDLDDMVAPDVMADPVALQKYLQTLPSVGDLEPAVVHSVADKEVGLLLDGGDTVSLPYDSANWASRASGVEVGARPKSLKSRFDVGEVIYIRKQGDQWVLGQLPTAQSALVSMEPSTGRLLALVGGYDFSSSKYNRATLARRQVGSSFKPFLYSAAINAGDNAATIYNDAPVRYLNATDTGDWTPKNYDGRFRGPTRLREALVRSSNLVSIRVLERVGVGNAIDFGRRFGFGDEALVRNMGLSLGTGAASPVQMASAYSVFANGGFAVQPTFVTKVTTNEGDVVEASQISMACAAENCPNDPLVTPAPRVLPEENAYIMRSMMRDVVKRGTAAKANKMGRSDLGGKTGTTNDQIDAWFAGFNRKLVTIVWVGRDDNKPLGKKETGGAAALPIWIDFMSSALEGTPNVEDPMPAKIVSASVDPATGQLVKSGGVGEIFIDGFLPDEKPPELILLPESTIDTGGGSSGGSGGGSNAGASSLEQIF
ncbi:MAG: PBP1A family penicillin-binding protein [Gammaproteobacteria bacterium]|nr:PBP1A family penicillin-binding protein [Gammaproteobacteria bacterium]